MKFEILPENPDASGKVVITEFVQDAGLGNQMMEFAAGYSLARTLNLPFRWVWLPSKLREFGLTHFGFGESPVPPYARLMHRAGQGNRALYERALKSIRESTEQFCAISCPFQDERCFIDHADEIRELFRLDPLPLNVPEGRTPVAVQVRRGDYVTHKRLNVTTEAYFLNAMEYMRQHVASPQFFIVSDDPTWCKERFGRAGDVTVMPPQEPIDGLRTMVACKAHIISNSTFGWWGAWLNESGPVVVPEIWYHGLNAYGDWEPVPDRWVKIGTGSKAAREQVNAAAGIFTPEPFIELPPPDLKRAIIYPWHSDTAKWEELRYSLRSVDKFFEDKECPIYILGTRQPGWLLKSPRLKFLDCWTYADALTRGCQMAEEVLWMNDDIAFLKPTGWDEVRKPVYLRPVDELFLAQRLRQANPWHQGVLRALRGLQQQGAKELKVFSTHTPYVYEREKALEVFRRFGVWQKAPMEMIYFNLFAKDPELLGNRRTQTTPFNGARYLNYNDSMLTPPLKQAIHDLLPDFAPWELKLAFP